MKATCLNAMKMSFQKFIENVIAKYNEFDSKYAGVNGCGGEITINLSRDNFPFSAMKNGKVISAIVMYSAPLSGDVEARVEEVERTVITAMTKIAPNFDNSSNIEVFPQSYVEDLLTYGLSEEKINGLHFKALVYQFCKIGFSVRNMRTLADGTVDDVTVIKNSRSNNYGSKFKFEVKRAYYNEVIRNVTTWNDERMLSFIVPLNDLERNLASSIIAAKDEQRAIVFDNIVEHFASDLWSIAILLIFVCYDKNDSGKRTPYLRFTVEQEETQAAALAVSRRNFTNFLKETSFNQFDDVIKKTKVKAKSSRTGRAPAKK